VLPGNTPMRGIIARRWATARPDYSSDCLSFRVPLPPLPRRRLPGLSRPTGRRRPRLAPPSPPGRGPAARSGRDARVVPVTPPTTLTP
jgi:hypothetical protein